MKLAKRLVAIAMAAVMVCSLNIYIGLANNSLIAEAVDYSGKMQYGDYLYYKRVDMDEDGIYDYVEIIGCDETAKEVIIPDVIDGLPVTLIGYRAFFECSGLTSVEIPNSVTSIGYAAFNNCSSLTSVEIPNSVTTIGYDAFYNCSGLTSINVSENNENYSSIYGVLFNKMQTELISYPKGKEDENYSIPSSVTLIGNGAFSGCSGLTSVEISNSITTIGEAAFYYCSSLTSITIKNADCEIYDSSSTIYNGYNHGAYYNGIICGYDGSTAQVYAEKYNYKFESLGEKPEKITGDANDDGKLSIRDATFIAILCAKGQYDGVSEWADYNGDGKRNIRDAAAIAIYCTKRSAGKI